jgi:cytochrome c oxidase subunit 2
MRPAFRRRRARPASRWVVRGVLLAGVVLATAGCQTPAWTRLGMPQPVTKQGHVTLILWQGSWIAAFCVGFLVWGLIIWSVIFYRKRSDRVPPQVRYNLPIEILYTVIPFIMIGVLFYFTARDENYIDKVSPDPAVIVRVTGFQWSWKFSYPQYKVPGSPYGVTETGQMWQPSAAVQHLPVLELPTGETVRFDLYSTDVVHSFWVPEFEFKRDVIPDHPNHFQVTLTRTGTFIGHCSELCGVYHSRMLFTLKIVTPAQFRTWIKGQQVLQASSGGVS